MFRNKLSLEIKFVIIGSDLWELITKIVSDNRTQVTFGRSWYYSTSDNQSFACFRKATWRVRTLTLVNADLLLMMVVRPWNRFWNWPMTLLYLRHNTSATVDKANVRIWVPIQSKKTLCPKSWHSWLFPAARWEAVKRRFERWGGW